MKQKKNLLTNNMKRFKTKNLDRVNEHVLGELPSQKLMKMKWNPLTEAMNIDVLQKEISELLPNYDDWNVQDGGIVKTGTAEGAHDLLVYRGDTLMGTVRNPMRSTGERHDDLLLLFFTKDWDSVRGGQGQYSGTRDEILNTIKTREFGTAQPLPADLDTDAGTSGGQDTTDGTPGASDTPGGQNTTDGSEIYDQEPSGGFCKRNLDLDWYFENIITGRSYLRLGDCGIAVETAQQHMNEFATDEAASAGQIGPLQVDGMYGPKTKKQTKFVQDLLSLKVDGLFGQKTHDAVMKAIKLMSTKIQPIGPSDATDTSDPDIATSLRQAAPVTNADNQEFKKKALKGKEKRRANRLKRIKNRQGRLKRKMDKLVR